MGTTAEKLTYLGETKAAIKDAIEGLGVPVGDVPFREYAGKIGSVQTVPMPERIKHLEAAQPAAPSHPYIKHRTINGIEFIAGGGILATADGAHWSLLKGNQGAITINDISAISETYVLAGDYGYIYTSTDLANWNYTQIDTSAKDFNCCIRYKSRMVVAGAGGKIMVSQDAVSWSTPASPFGSTEINDLMVYKGKLIAVAQSGKIATSDDGVSWELEQTNVTWNIRGVVNHKGTAVAYGWNAVLVSDNGVDWTEHALNLTLSNFGDYVVSHNGILVSVREGVLQKNIFAISTDAVNWTLKTLTNADDSIRTRGLFSSFGRLVMFGQSSYSDAQSVYTIDGHWLWGE